MLYQSCILTKITVSPQCCDNVAQGCNNVVPILIPNVEIWPSYYIGYQHFDNVQAVLLWILWLCRILAALSQCYGNIENYIILQCCHAIMTTLAECCVTIVLYQAQCCHNVQAILSQHCGNIETVILQHCPNIMTTLRECCVNIGVQCCFQCCCNMVKLCNFPTFWQHYYNVIPTLTERCYNVIIIFFLLMLQQ